MPLHPSILHQEHPHDRRKSRLYRTVSHVTYAHQACHASRNLYLASRNSYLASCISQLALLRDELLSMRCRTMTMTMTITTTLTYELRKKRSWQCVLASAWNITYLQYTYPCYLRKKVCISIENAGVERSGYDLDGTSRVEDWKELHSYDAENANCLVCLDLWLSAALAVYWVLWTCASINCNVCTVTATAAFYCAFHYARYAYSDSPSRKVLCRSFSASQSSEWRWSLFWFLVCPVITLIG